MAYVLSLSPNSPLISPIVGNEAPVRSSCSVASLRSSGTVHHNRLRSISTSSLSSVGSYFVPSSLRRQHGQTDTSAATPSRSVSSINLNMGNLSLNKIRNQLGERSTGSASNSRHASFTSAFSGRPRSESIASPEQRDFRLVDVLEHEHELLRPKLPSPTPESGSEDEDETLEEDEEETLHQNGLPTATLMDAAHLPSGESPTSSSLPEPPAFRRWVSKLRRKRHDQPPPLPCVSPRQERWTLDDFDPRPEIGCSPRKIRHSSAHHKSDSQNSSLRFITSVRSATATLASASIATMSRQWRRGHQRSSIISGSDPRPSVDSARSIIDEAAKQRSRKRREKLEEIIRTEESYVADVKALSNAYFTILGHHPTATSFARPAAQKVIADILHLHDDILSQLHQVVPFAEYDRSTARPAAVRSPRTHNRWHSIDGVPSRSTPPRRAALTTIRHGRQSLNISRSEDDEKTALRCSPQVVAAVTEVFVKHLGRFCAYEEYGANYDLVQRDIDESQRGILSWADYDKAIEALSAHVNPMRSREANKKKAMTVKDLLIKPIQRIPRYELLFNELARLTPVCDDPGAHAAIEELCQRLSETCRRMNEAKDNTTRARVLETTWLIGDRLSFSGQLPKSTFLQLLGHVQLCGCLHIAYRGRERVKGRYVICILFESTLLLASADDDLPTYSTLAAIALANATVEETDNQKGLQCHTAPHSWKVIFESSGKMYELICTACSATEAEIWRASLGAGIEVQSLALSEGKMNVLPLQSPLTLEMKSIGKAFGKPSSFVRRMSVHRAATIGPTSDLNQVIIKNTQAVKDVLDNASQTSLQIPRSQSVQTPSHVQTLAPRRAERHRLESILTDVWSKDVLPYPGMIRRSDPIRASANHVIRKFSMASITSNFSSSKRTASHTSINSWRKEDLAPSRATKSSRRDSITTASSRCTRPAPVNFHNAPDAFLPADFELIDPGKSRKRSALRTFTLTMERPFSPLLSTENKPSGLRRAQSVRDGAEDQPPPLPSSSPLPTLGNDEDRAPQRLMYSVVQERAKTPATLQVIDDAVLDDVSPAKQPRKSKSRLLRLFH